MVVSRDRPVQAKPAVRLVLLYDNSSSQHLELYARPDLQPLNRMIFERRRDQAIRALVDTAGGLIDVRLASFGERILLSPGWARTVPEVRKAFDSVWQPGGPSPIWDAVVRVVDALEPGVRSTAILLVSDGKASANALGFDEARARAGSASVRVFVAAMNAPFGRRLNQSRPGDPTLRLKQLAETTGGQYIETALDDLPTTLARLVGAVVRGER
jgi:hypothetical protein